MVRRLSSSLIKRRTRSPHSIVGEDAASSMSEAARSDFYRGLGEIPNSEQDAIANNAQEAEAGLNEFSSEPSEFDLGYSDRDQDEELDVSFSKNNVIVVNEEDGGSGSTNKSKTPILDFLQKVTFFFLITLAFVVVTVGCLFLAFNVGKTFGENRFSVLGAPNASSTSPIGLEERAIDEWSANFNVNFVIERKVQSLSVGFNPSENVLLGKYEDKALGRKREAALHYALAAALGNLSARVLLSDLNLSDEDRSRVREDFIALHELNGEEGHLRLGQYYLGNDLFPISRHMSTEPRFKKPNDFLGEPDYYQAYENFQIASLCGSTTAYEWRSEVARYYKMTDETRGALNSRANQKLKTLEKQVKGDRDDYCQSAHLQKAYDLVLAGPAARLGASVGAFDSELSAEICQGGDLDQRTAMLCDYLSEGYNEDDLSELDEFEGEASTIQSLMVPRLRDVIELIFNGASSKTYRSSGRRGGDPVAARGPNGGAASQYYRNSPGAAASGNIKTKAQDGLPDDCVQFDAGGICKKRESALACNDRAAYHFKKGEAEMAIGNTRTARRRFLRASSVGRVCGSEYAVLAAKRLAALNLTCEYTEKSLARISRGGSNNETGGALIDLKSRQRALQALGHYDGNIDGKYGPKSREAAKRFQREFGFSETGDITPIETVYLVCGAAQNANDVKSMNTLGIMYVAGLGVTQNTDNGVYWLKLAADRENSDAMYNLALIYGSGTILSSYKLCSVVENVDIADSYLRQAYDKGHPRAAVLVKDYGKYGPTERWSRIKKQLEQENEFYNKRLKSVGEGCRPRFPAPQPPAPGPAETEDASSADEAIESALNVN